MFDAGIGVVVVTIVVVDVVRISSEPGRGIVVAVGGAATPHAATVNKNKAGIHWRAIPRVISVGRT